MITDADGKRNTYIEKPNQTLGIYKVHSTFQN